MLITFKISLHCDDALIVENEGVVIGLSTKNNVDSALKSKDIIALLLVKDHPHTCS